MAARAEEIQVLSDTLRYWAVYEPAVKCEIGCAAIKVASGWVLTDPVPLGELAWGELLAEGEVRAILITNANHVRDAEALRKRFQVPIVTAPDTRRAITELRPDIALLPNEQLYGIKAIAIPGATEGETAFHSDTGVMILGDAVINVSPEAGLEFLPDKYCDDAKQNRESLKKLLECDFHTLILAHGPPITTRAREKLAALLEFSL
jgi:glyoxylase-like metal-dependent hydrolase (beta-lactamase superfamily II)